MGFKKVISDYFGKLSELVSGDTIAPSQLGTGTIVDRSILKGNGTWGKNDNSVYFVIVDTSNSPLELDFDEDTLVIILATDPNLELRLNAAQGVKLTCYNTSSFSIKINTIPSSLSPLIGYVGGYILSPFASCQMIKDDGNTSYLLFEDTPLVKTISTSASTFNIVANDLQFGKNLFIDADVPNGGMDINLPIISTLNSLDVIITIKYRNYVTSTDILTTNSQGTDYLDGFAATSLALTRFDCISFKPHSTGEWLQIGKFKFFDTTSANSYIITEIDFGTTPISSKKFTITAAGVTPTDVIHVFTDSTEATDRVGDDWEVDMAFFTAVAGTGNFTLNVTSPYNMVGKRSIKYKVN